MAAMRMTFLGHVGFFVETRGGSVLCDPWFTPAYFGSWFPFPAQRPTRPGRVRVARLPLHLAPAPRPLRSASGSPRHVDKRRAGAAARRSACRSSSASCARSASSTSCGRRDGEPVDLDGLTVDDPRVHQPGRRAARRLADRRSTTAPRASLNQNDARPGDPDALRAPRAVRRPDRAVLGRDLVSDRVRLPARAEGSGSRATSASTRWPAPASTSSGSTPRTSSRAPGPPAFLDDDLFALNDVDRDPANIFPDQTVFLELLARRRHRHAASCSCPGRSSSSTAGECKVTHPGADAEVLRPFTDKRAYLDEYRRDWSGVARTRARVVVAAAGATSSASSPTWFEPLLRARADHVGRHRGQRRARRRRTRRERVHRLRRVGGAAWWATASRTSTRPTSTGG